MDPSPSRRVGGTSSCRQSNEKVSSATPPDQNRLALLNKFAKFLLEAETESDVAWSIAKQAIAHLGFEDCVIYLKDPQRDVLLQAAAHGPKNPENKEILAPIMIPFGKGIVGAAAESGKSQRVADVSKDPRYIVDDQHRASELAVPMMHHGECLGVVDSESMRRGFYTEDHVSVLETVAALGAARIVNIRAMQQLEASRTAYRHLVENASDIVFRSDKRGFFTYVNPVALQITGYDESELLSMQFIDLVAPQHRLRVRNFYRDQYRQERMATYLEFQVLRKGGDLCWIGQNTQMIRVENQEVVFQAFARDITTLKLAQEAVSRSRAVQQVMLHASLDAIISIDREGHVTEFNAAAERTFGFKMEEVFGRKLSELIIPPELRGAHNAGMKRLLETGNSTLIGKRIEVPALHQDGHTFPIELTLTEIKTADSVQFTAFARDITEQKKAKETLEKAREQAESFAEAQTRFLSSMSHEIRTPLNAVIGISHLLQDTGLSARQQKYTSDILRAGNVLLGLINNILDFQKLESGFMQLERITFSLHDLLDEVMDRARYIAAEKPLDIRLRRGSSVPVWINSDPVRITQILTNLLSNAVKFTPQGSVTLTVSASESAEEQILEFTVRDTGIGIAEESLGKVFDTFAQAGSDITRRYGGSGLGLPIVQQLVRAFGGTIEMKSTEGVGSTFTVRLPVLETDDEEARVHFSGPSSLRLDGVRLLVVEDNMVNQFVAQEMLQSWGAVVRLASEGFEALDILGKETFDVALMDIQMPEMDGFETTRRIRQDLGITAEQMPVIALTASALREQRDRAFEAGMNDFVMKPFDPVHLHSRISLSLIQAGEPGLIPKETQTPAQESVAEDPVTDWTFFKANYGANQGLKKRILGLIAEQIPKQRKELEAAIAEADPETIRFMAHKLLPSVKMTGTRAAERICARIAEDHVTDCEALELSVDLPAWLKRLESELAQHI